jgi:hypothetical protein
VRAADLWVRRDERGKYDSLGELAAGAPHCTAPAVRYTGLVPRQTTHFVLWPALRRPVPPAPAPAHAEKLRRVQALCARLGVLTEPACVGGLWVFPLLSWYHASWDSEPDVAGAQPISKVCGAALHGCVLPLIGCCAVLCCTLLCCTRAVCMSQAQACRLPACKRLPPPLPLCLRACLPTARPVTPNPIVLHTLCVHGPPWCGMFRSPSGPPDTPFTISAAHLGCVCVLQVMLDFHVCSWASAPHLNAHDESLAAHFDALNEPAFSAALKVTGRGGGSAWGAMHLALMVLGPSVALCLLCLEVLQLCF